MADEQPLIANDNGGIETPATPPPATPLQAPDLHRDRQMGRTLTEAIEHGKENVPVAPEPLVCKPQQLESWRVFKIMAEFVDGFEILRKYGLTATFFGSARASMGDDIYEAAEALSSRLAKYGFAIVSGGSAGIMQAANKGAFEVGGASVGLNIRLEDNQGLNAFLTDSMFFDHFFVRKVMLAYASEVYIYFPGGYGTLDELFEIVTLVQTKKIKRVPIVLYGTEYWTPIIELLTNHLFKRYGAIDEADLALIHLVDSVDEAYDYIIENVRC
ncbi:MAG TPA: TIGR00730 family Rossman fold protein [Candidatus Paceibacterota bacterium]|nr:TIGR00730 family Rossman fold protein [Candidatus Paceibacterota bacterium]